MQVPVDNDDEDLGFSGHCALCSRLCSTKNGLAGTLIEFVETKGPFRVDLRLQEGIILCVGGTIHRVGTLFYLLHWSLTTSLEHEQERTQRTANIVVLRDIDVDAVTNAVSIDQTPQEVPPPPPPSPPTVKSDEERLSLPTITEAPKVSAPSPPPTASSSVSMPQSSGIDLPLPAIGAGLVAAFAATTFAMRGSVDEREERSSSSPVAAASPDDISIPYDAAARLAYETSDKSMDYNAFQKKYEADAIADVVAKKKK